MLPKAPQAWQVQPSELIIVPGRVATQAEHCNARGVLINVHVGQAQPLLFIGRVSSLPFVVFIDPEMFTLGRFDLRSGGGVLLFCKTGFVLKLTVGGGPCFCGRSKKQTSHWRKDGLFTSVHLGQDHGMFSGPREGPASQDETS